MRNQRVLLQFSSLCPGYCGPSAVVVRPAQLLAAKHQAGAVPRFEGHFSRQSTCTCISEAGIYGRIRCCYASSIMALYECQFHCMPVPLYEFELRELLVEATVKSGWLQVPVVRLAASASGGAAIPTRRVQAKDLLTSALWATSFACRY